MPSFRKFTKPSFGGLPPTGQRSPDDVATARQHRQPSVRQHQAPPTRSRPPASESAVSNDDYDDDDVVRTSEPPVWPIYTEAEKARLRKASEWKPKEIGTVIMTKPPEPPKPIEPEVTLEDLKAKLTFNPKHPDNFEAWVVAKHIRILGLAESIGIDPDEPDTKQFRVEVGVLKRALNQ